MCPEIKRPSRHAFVFLLLLLTAHPAAAQLSPLPLDQGATGLGLALRRLPVTARVLYVTAHPDDENNAVLVGLSRGLGVRTGLLTLTRGEGGQNAIGPELGEALGVLRTEELLAVHRYDGVQQFFGAAYEFGFSFSLEETFEKWGHEETLGDVVHVLRSFRPEVILTLPTDAPDHQHHVAAARLAVEAFRAAADPQRYPDQISAGLRPWQARAIFAGGVGGGNETSPGLQRVALHFGSYDPLLGMSWAELGSLSRTMHKCQAARQLKISPGEFADARFVLVDAEPAAQGQWSGVLDGMDTSILGLLQRFPVPRGEMSVLGPALEAITVQARRAAEAYDARAPQRTVPALAAGLTAVRSLAERLRSGSFPEPARSELLDRLDTKEQDFLAALALAQGLLLEATADDDDVVPGQTFTVTARAWNQGAEPVGLEELALRLPPGWTSEASPAPGEPPAALGPGQGVVRRYQVHVADAAPLSEPYWHRSGTTDRYTFDAAARSLPWRPPQLLATLRYRVADVSAVVERPAAFRYEGRWVGGEKEKLVNVVPPVSLRLTPPVAVFPAGGPSRREFRVPVRQYAKGKLSPVVHLELPAGWTVEPREARVTLAAEGEETVARFVVTSSAAAAEGQAPIAAVAAVNGHEFRQGDTVVAYDHIQERRLYRPATTRGLVLDVKVNPAARVGYVAGVGDEVAEAIGQLGVPLTALSADDLADGDLSRFSTIVTGVRAYQARPDLRRSQSRLMRWVEDGGHLVVQYNRGEFNPNAQEPSPYAPYPARVSTARITDETAPMEMLAPSSPLLTTPNRISSRDWAGWTQERAIQLFETQDSRYTDLLAAADPFPKNAGQKRGLLVDAAVGKGTWTYVALVLFRELPAGVPGAYRLLANLVSRPRSR